MSTAVLHPVTPDGRTMHWFERQGDKWVCECGTERDPKGRTEGTSS